MPSRYWKRILLLGLLMCLFASPTMPAVRAQTYKFSVDRNISQVIVQPDGSANIEYWLTFTCAQGAHAIDAVDIGLPNSSYDLGTAQAWYNPGMSDDSDAKTSLKTELTAISRSPYVDIGVAIDLGEHAIQPGDQGTIHFQINVPRMVYPDSQDANYASIEFAPTYFDRKLVQGTTNMEIRFLFPPGVTNEETRYHDQPFDAVDQSNNRIVFIYTYPEATGYETHQHGISFPGKYVDTVHVAPTAAPTRRAKVPIVKARRSLGHWIEETLEQMGPPGWMSLMILFYGMIFGLGKIRKQRRKMRYLPPTLSVEGVGIKRGLTAVEAAILLETPLNKVLTMILFGILKKKGVVVLDENPLKLEAIDPKPKASWRFYENRFLSSIKKDGTLDEPQLQRMIVDLIKRVNKKLKGFSRKETVDYYRNIIDRAWKQVQADTTPEIKSRHLDRDLEWMMLDRDFQGRTNETFHDAPVHMPSWWAYYRPWRARVQAARVHARPSASGSGSSIDPGRSPSTARGSSRERPTLSLPTLPGSAFAGTIVSSIEHTSGEIVSRLETFTGGVTGKTNPIPVSKRSGGSSGGSSFRSGGCACACACACAGCACACAGGGR